MWDKAEEGGPKARDPPISNGLFYTVGGTALIVCFGEMVFGRDVVFVRFPGIKFFLIYLFLWERQFRFPEKRKDRKIF